MVQDDKIQQSVTNYELDNKKFIVITKCVENVPNIDKLYDIVCKYAVSQINSIWMFKLIIIV